MAWAIVTSFYFGILASISPCPLATNIAAISFLGAQAGRTGRVILAGAMYTLGRTLAYVVLGAAIVAGLLSVPAVSEFLRTDMNSVLGPVLILTGMLLLGLIPLKLPSVSAGRAKRLAERGSVLSAAVMGAIFALSMCPVSAGLFFGGPIPLALQHESYFLLPCVFGVATALPVMVCAVLLALAATWAAKAFNVLTRIDKWLRSATGAVFVVAGVYWCLVYIFGVL